MTTLFPNLFTELKNLTDELSKNPVQKPTEPSNKMTSGGIYIEQEKGEYIKIIDIHTSNIHYDHTSYTKRYSIVGEGIVKPTISYTTLNEINSGKSIIRLDINDELFVGLIMEIKLETFTENKSLIARFMLETTELQKITR